MKYILILVFNLMFCQENLKNYDIIINHIKYYEGFKNEPYEDTNGNLTIGFGHLITKTEEFTTITKKQSEDILKSDFNEQYRIIKIYFKSCNENQILGLSLLCYNIGIKRLLKSSMVRKFKNNENFYYDWMIWNKVGGVSNERMTQRRVFEYILFTTKSTE